MQIAAADGTDYGHSSCLTWYEHNARQYTIDCMNAYGIPSWLVAVDGLEGGSTATIEMDNGCIGKI